ncbi:NHLP leader peptide family RiPP precursor [Chryseobacterium sp. Leaf201]|uniref:NHLP leader peptide family RiPP precursor n=1 Tax=Chryseobacterium sp. Leaf201 TaxID=1735672 RepID=UPI0006F74DAA|nr:NHLP leader peptide family RiPP precursor [Chryseobacterium sp. Leaf201]KQM19132.1 TOMM propeptide domain-containing protein [Chryseobacterium sp. Leaf201]
MEITQDQKIYAEIVQKAWDDADFKKELMENPKAAIEKLTGKKLNLPEGKTLVVKDQTDESQVFINIPAKVNADDAELNDEQLEAVAGGADPLTTVTNWAFNTGVKIGTWLVS